jgi:hypothetical protein
MPSPASRLRRKGAASPTAEPFTYSSLESPTDEIGKLQISSGGAETTAWFAQRLVLPTPPAASLPLPPDRSVGAYERAARRCVGGTV